jgi:hypothetical protein
LSGEDRYGPAARSERGNLPALWSGRSDKGFNEFPVFTTLNLVFTLNRA